MKVIMKVWFEEIDKATVQEVKDAIVEGLETVGVEVESIQVEV